MIIRLHNFTTQIDFMFALVNRNRLRSQNKRQSVVCQLQNLFTSLFYAKDIGFGEYVKADLLSCRVEFMVEIQNVVSA